MMEMSAREYLDQIPFWTRKKNTLKEVGDFLIELGNPQDKLSIIHVAGTNGKGSVCADMTEILNQAGYQVGTFVSPHLTDVTERFLLNGKPVEEADFRKSFHTVLDVVGKMTDKGYCHPTFFEFVFLMAMVLYGEVKPDYVILETGLGGLFDTTNVIKNPLACVITSIGLDHTEYLGETIAQIAEQKAGIIKPGVPVIFDDNVPDASAVIMETAKAKASPCYPVGKGQAYTKTKFAAPYQAMNAALAVKTLQVLAIEGVDEQVCESALAKVSWTGRMQQVLPDVWVDGAHNPDGIRAFIQAVKGHQEQEKKKVKLLFAAVADKDYKEMIALLSEELGPVRVKVVQLSSERSAKPEIIVDLFRQSGCDVVEYYHTVKQAVQAALADKTVEDRLYIVGSLYLIGEVLKQLKEN